MPYHHPQFHPFSLKTNRYELYALGEAVAGWRGYVRQDAENQVIEIEKSFIRQYHLSELSRKVIARKLIDQAGNEKDFRVQVSAPQLVTAWVCYQVYGECGQHLSSLRAIMAKFDKEMVNRLTKREIDCLAGASL